MSLVELFAIGPGWGDELLRGFLVTLQIALLAYAGGTLLGLLAAFGELSSRRWLSLPLQAYAMVLRSVPELLVIFLFYYGGSFAVQGLLGLVGVDRAVDVDAFTAGTVALALIQGAYASEVFRGAILAVPSGAVEAARSLGLRRLQILRTVVVPLALRVALAGLVNLWMVVIKNTPFVSAIGLEDFIRAAGTAGQNTKQYFAFYLAVLLTYLAISAATMLVQSRLSDRLFRHLDRGRSPC